MTCFTNCFLKLKQYEKKSVIWEVHIDASSKQHNLVPRVSHLTLGTRQELNFSFLSCSLWWTKSLTIRKKEKTEVLFVVSHVTHHSCFFSLWNFLYAVIIPIEINDLCCLWTSLQFFSPEKYISSSLWYMHVAIFRNSSQDIPF